VDKLKVLNIDPEQFDLLVAAPELGALKPSKPCAEKVMKMLDADPSTTLFVGDRDEKDGETARVVGAKFLLV
jgi:phosphoglycolate phosphatase